MIEEKNKELIREIDLELSKLEEIVNLLKDDVNKLRVRVEAKELVLDELENNLI